MSAAVDNLDDLDNKAIREKCLEFGLPNVPITDTNRKLLIKRLRIAMGADPKEKEKPKSRRETIHVIKVDKEDDAPKTPTKTKPAGRRTIGTPIVPPEQPTELARAAVTQRRRSGRTTPISQLKPVTPYSAKRKAEFINEEDEEEPLSNSVIIEKSSETITTRQVRAPSLSKSVVVTTSYVKDTTPDIHEKDIIELEDSDPEEIEEEEEMDYEPEPVRYKYVSTSRNYDSSKPFSKPLERSSIHSYSSPVQQQTSRISLSKAPTLTASYETAASRRYTTGGGFKTATDGNENRTFAHHTDFNESNEEEMDSPFLSDFARRLSRLKAEPMNPVVQTQYQAESPLRETSHYYKTSVAGISGRRSIARNESIGDSFNKFLVALDRKYNLKRNFTIFAIILAIILVYVLFF